MLAFVRICSHYFANGAWLEDGVLLRDAHRLAGIPGVLIHGWLDMGGPLDMAWQLTRAWPGAELTASITPSRPDGGNTAGYRPAAVG